MSGLHRVADAGGADQLVTALETSHGDTSHAWPVFLPDGTHFLYFVRSADDERRGLYVGRSDRPPEMASKPLVKSDSNAVFVPDADGDEGELLYVSDQRIEARRFNTRTITLGAAPRTIASLVAAGTTLAYPAMLSASSDVLAFATATVPYGHRLEAVERNGQRARVWEQPEAQNWPRLSPDGRYLARQRVDELRNTPDIWVEDLERGTTVRVTTALEPDCRPVWSPDGRQLAYVSGNIPRRSGRRVLNIAAADGTGIVKSLPCPSEYCEPTDWASGELVVNTVAPQTQDIWLVPVGGGEPRRLLAEGFVERDGRVAPNGQWFAYVSSESGRPQVSIRTLKGDPRRIPVSSDGGDHPVWRRDGSELFFVDPQGQLMSVPVTWTRGSPALGVPAKVNVPPIGRGHWGTPYDVSPDGNRIYLLRRNNETGPREIHVVIGWRALIN
jgi:dipeptidyl aminopeptidase/acylaminoacyl peptidase